MINHLDTFEVAVILLHDEVMLRLHLCFDCIEWVPHDSVGSAKEDAAEQRVQPFFVPISPFMIMSHI